MSKIIARLFRSCACAASAAIALCASFPASGAGMGVNDRYWAAPGGAGAWNEAANWYSPFERAFSVLPEGNSARFTNSVSSLTLAEGEHHRVYAFNASGATAAKPYSARVSGGALTFALPTSDFADNNRFANMTVVFSGVAVTNANSTRGVSLMHNSNFVLKDGASLYEPYSDESAGKFLVGFNAQSATSNSLTIAEGSSLETARTIAIGLSTSSASNPTGVVHVAGGVLRGKTLWAGSTGGNGQTGGYGALVVDGGGKVSLSGDIEMGSEYTEKHTYNGVGAVEVSGEGSRIDVAGDFYFHEYGYKNITVADGGVLSVKKNFYQKAESRNQHATTVLVKNGGVLEIGNISFTDHNPNTYPGSEKCAFTVDGGTVRALASFTTLSANGNGDYHAVTVGENGWTFDTQNYNVIWKRTINYGTGTFTKTGAGYLEFYYVPVFPGAIDIREGTVGLSGSSAKFPGAITVRSGAAFKKTAVFSSEQDASFTLEAGAILQPYQADASAAPSNIVAKSVILPAQGTVTVRLGDNGTQAPAAGAYKILTLASGTFPAGAASKFSTSLANAGFALSPDKKSIMLQICTALPGKVWTGRGDGRSFSDPANWLDNAVPAGGEALYFLSGGNVTNDLGALSVKSVTFAESIANAGINIYGDEFTGVVSVTNHVRYNNVNFRNKLTFSGAIDSNTPGGQRTAFFGGPTGKAPINHGYLQGNYTITDATWTPASGTRVAGTVVAKALNNPNTLKVEKGGHLIADSVTASNNRVFEANNGEITINGNITLKHYNSTFYNAKSEDGILRAKGFRINAGQSSGNEWVRLHGAAGNSVKIEVGSNGLGYESGSHKYTRYHMDKSQTTALYAGADFTIADHPNYTHRAFSIDSGSYLALYTNPYDDYNSTRSSPKTITVAGKITQGGGVKIYGSGTVYWTKASTTSETLFTGGVSVYDSATLKVAKDALPGNGAVTMATGTTLQLPAAGSGAVTLGTSFKVTNASGCDCVYVKLGEGTETLSKKQYNLFTVSAGLPAGTDAKMRLVNPVAEGLSTHFDIANGTLVLYVGDTPNNNATHCIWTGAGGDGLFSNAANWLGGRRPQDVASAIVRFNGAGGEVVNDVDNLSVASLMFSSGVNAITLSGKPITVSGNISLDAAASVSPVIKAKIYTTQTATLVGQPALGYTYRDRHHIVFEGGLEGASGCSLSTADSASRVIFGHYAFPSSTLTANTQGSDTGANRRWGVMENSSLTVGTLGNVNEISVGAGGALTAGVYNVTARMSWQVPGEIVVTDTLTMKSSNAFSWSAGSNWKVNKTVLTGSYVMSAHAANVDGMTHNYHIGPGGIEFASGATGHILLNRASNVLNFRPWNCDCTFGTKGTSTQDLYLQTGSYAAFYTEDENGTPRTFTLDALVSGGVAQRVYGSGVLRCNNTRSTNTGVVTVYDTATVAYGPGAKHGTGAITFNGGTRLLAAEPTATSALGAVTLKADATLAVSNLTASVAPLSVSSLSADEGVFLSLEGDSVLADGTYTVLASTGGNLDSALAGRFVLKGPAIAGKNASLSVDGANLVLTVAGEGQAASGIHVWTGEGGNANFSNADNWLGGSVPQALDGKGISFPAASGTLVNDIEGLTPRWIRFGANIGEVEIAGANGFSDVYAITNNSSSANVVFSVPVAYAAGETIEVFHNGKFDNSSGLMTGEKGLVVFAGGVTGAEVRSYDSAGDAAKSGQHNVYAGVYRRTGASAFTSTLGSSDYRTVIYKNSSLSVDTAGNTLELDICEGGAFTARVVSATGSSLAYRDRGEFAVTEKLVYNYDGDTWAHRGSPETSPVFKIEELSVETASSTWFFLACETKSHGTYYIGEGGIKWPGGSSPASVCLGNEVAGSDATLRPWKSDTAIGARGDGKYNLVFNKYGAAFDTRDESGAPRTITIDAVTLSRNGASIAIRGGGVVAVNGANVDEGLASVAVEDATTLKFGSSAATFGAGAASMAAGSTLAVPLADGADAPLLGSSLAVSGEGKVNLVLGDIAAPAEIPAGDYGVCRLSGGIPGDAAAFAASVFDLRNATAQDAVFYSADGCELRLKVGAGAAAKCVWTGGGDDANFSNPDNWLCGFVPGPGTKEFAFPSASGALVNDIAGLSPSGITFGAGIGALSVSGNAFSGVGAITNLSSSVTPVLETPVSFAGDIAVSTTAALGSMNSSFDGGTVDFAGGATGAAISGAGANIMKGRFTCTGTAKSFAATTSGGARWTVTTNSHASVAACGNTKELYIQPGAVFTAENRTVSVDGERLWCWNQGAFVVNGTLAVTSGEHFLGYVGDQRSWKFAIDSPATLYAGALSIEGASTLLWLGNINADAARSLTHCDIYVGASGMQIGASCNGCYAVPKYCTARIAPWNSGFTIAARPSGDYSGTFHGDFFTNGDTEFCTTGADSNAYTITIDAKLTDNGGGGAIAVTGNGVLEINSTYVSGHPRTGKNTVKDAATLKFGALASLGTGELAFDGGTTLAMPLLAEDAQAAAIAGSLVYGEDGANGEGTVSVVLGDGSALADGVYKVLAAGSKIDGGFVKRLALANETANPAQFYTSADGLTLYLSVGSVAYDGPCLWTGAGDGYRFSDAANWLHSKRPCDGGPHDVVIGAKEPCMLENDLSGLSVKSITFSAGSECTAISGEKISGVAVVTNLGLRQVFYAPVEFAGTYRSVHTGEKVFYYGGATASYPDPAQRTSSSSDLNRTLYGTFEFTEDWDVPGIGDNDKPWIIPSGSEVHGKVLKGTQTHRRRILRIESGGSAYFTAMTNGWSVGDIDVDGYLEVEGEIVVETWQGSDGWSNFGTSGNKGTVKAGKFAKVGTSYVYSRIPNLIVGAGGIGSIVQDWAWRFYVDTTVTAAEDFEFLGVYRSANTNDWGVWLDTGVTLTVDAGEGRTVTMGAGVFGNNNGGTIRKTGAGTLVMTDTFGGQSGFGKNYGKTTVEEGTVRFVAGSLGMGAVTVKDGAVLEIASGATLPAANAVTVEAGGTLLASGSGARSIAGSCTLDGAVLGFRFTQTGESPWFAFASAPALKGNVYVNLGFTTPIAPRSLGGKMLLATGVGDLDVGNLEFADDIAPKPTWVADVDHPFVVEDGNLYLKVKKPGFSITVR